MRVVMQGLLLEGATLGDREPIPVQSIFIPRQPPAVRPAKVVKRRLVPPVH
jgi:hypothetical protein